MNLEKSVILSLIALNVLLLGFVLWDGVQSANANTTPCQISLVRDEVTPLPADWQLTGDPLPPDQG